MTNEHPQPIVDALKNRSCVIFFGSGISAESGLPTGEGLIKRLLHQEQGSIINDYDLAKIAQIQRHKHRETNNWLLNQLQKALNVRAEPNDLHRLLVMLNSKYYITTNYDRLFDEVLQEQLGDEDLPRIVTDADMSKSGDIVYIKLHGDIYEGDSIVLTYDDYETKFEKNPNLVHLLYSLFAQNLVLFVGYSLKDPNILSIVRKIGQKSNKGLYMVLVEPKPGDRDLDLVFLDSLNVNVIPLKLSEGQNIGKRLRQWLLELWDKIISEESYDLYLSTVPVELPYEIQISLAVQIYNNGDYSKANRLFQGLFNHNEAGRYWRKRPELFGQVSYYSIKTLDKLNDWHNLEIMRQKILEKLRGLKSLYGDDIVMLVENQMNASVGTALMRSCQYKKAYDIFKESLDAQPVGYLEREYTEALIADRHTSLASICLCRALLARADDADTIHEEAQVAFLEAKKIYDKHKLRTPDRDDHYLGRFYGTKVFLQIALDKINIRLIEDTGKLFEDGILAHTGNRKPYGRIAGKYCHGVAHLYIGMKRKQAGNMEQAVQHFSDAEKLWHDCLESEEASELTLSSLDYCKIYTALSRLYAETGEIQKNEKIQTLLQKKRSELMADIIPDNIILNENWIFTPLN